MSASVTPVILLLICTSCDRPAIDPSQSLVGAKSLPPARELMSETIEIYLGEDKSLSHQLSYELRKDNSLTLTLSAVERGKRSLSQKFQLRSADADALRRKLWRVRPEELKGLAWMVQPADCPPPPTDTSPMLSVGFIQEGTKPGIEDDHIGVFILPYPYTCKTPGGNAARALLKEVLKALPGSRLQSQYVYHPPLP